MNNGNKQFRIETSVPPLRVRQLVSERLFHALAFLVQGDPEEARARQLALLEDVRHLLVARQIPYREPNKPQPAAFIGDRFGLKHADQAFDGWP